MAVDPEVRALARQLNRLERASILRKQPGLAYSTIEDGALTAVDVDGLPTMVIGQQYDGTNTSAVVAGPTPPTPLAPGVAGVLGGLIVYWDGTFTTALVAPMDYSRVTIHAYPSAGFTTFNPLDQTRIVGTFSSATGGEMLIGLGTIEYLIFLVSWSQAGKFSEESVPSFGTPAKISMIDFGAEAAAQLAKADAALTAATDAGAVASSAQTAATSAQSAAATAADQAATATGIASGKGVVRIQGTAPAAIDQNATTLWIDTSDGNKPKRWNATNSTWVAVQDQAAITAAANAASALSAANQASTVASDAHALAVAAADAADAAGALAQSAMNSASGKNTIIRATYPPLNEANAIGDLWWYRDSTTGKILGLYQGLGANAWAQQTITNEIIGNLDAGKITFGMMSGERIETASLVVGQVGGLGASLDAKATLTQAQIIADIAEADAVATSQTAFGATKTRVTDWTMVGKTTMNGGLIETDTVTAIQIKAGSVTAVEADITSLWAGVLRAGLVQAGFVLAGKIQVGSATWDPANGLVIPQPGGGTITLPSDGVTPASITAHLIAQSLHVKNDLTIAGYGELIGTIAMTNGTTAPTVMPSLSQSWPMVLGSSTQALGDGMASTEVFCGLAPHHSNVDVWSVAVSYFGAGIRLVNKNTGGLFVYPDPTDGKAWCVNYHPDGGIACVGGFYFLLGSDSDRSGDFYIYKINTTFDKVAELRIGDINAFGGRTPRLGQATAAGQVLMIWSSANGDTNLRRYPTSLGSFTDRVTATGQRFNFGGVLWEDVDGTANQVIFVASQTGTVKAYNGNTASTSQAPVTSKNFMPAFGSDIRGMGFDARNNRVVSYDSYGNIYTYSKIDVTTQVNAAYSYYDGDGGAYPAGTIINGVDKSGVGSGTHETQGSPVKTTNIGARAWVKVETSPAPDADVTDSTRVDKANRIGIYVSRTSLGAAQLQTFLPTGTREWVSDVIPTGGKLVPTTNGFSTAYSAPGRIISGALRSDGRPMIEIDGGGGGRMGPVWWSSAGTILQRWGGQPYRTLDVVKHTGTAMTLTTTRQQLLSATITSAGTDDIFEVNGVVDFQCTTGSASTAVGELQVDGVADATSIILSCPTSGFRVTAAQNWRITGMAAGTHTIRIFVYKTATAGVLLAQPNHTTMAVKRAAGS